MIWQAVEKGEITPGKVKGRRFELLLETIQVTAGVITREIASLRELSEWLG